MSVTIGGFNFEYTVPDFKYRNIKGTATEIEYHDFFIFFLV